MENKKDIPYIYSLVYYAHHTIFRSKSTTCAFRLDLSTTNDLYAIYVFTFLVSTNIKTCTVVGSHVKATLPLSKTNVTSDKCTITKTLALSSNASYNYT